jgi:hypothetical protein
MPSSTPNHGHVPPAQDHRPGAEMKVAAPAQQHDLKIVIGMVMWAFRPPNLN